MNQHNREIAIVGLSCRYPGAGGALELWENSLACRRQFRRIPDCRFPLADYFDPNARDKTYAQRAAVMDWKNFDHTAHGIARSTFESTDAVQWLALEVAIEAMTDAGYARGAAPSLKSGVIFGNTLNGEQSRTNGIRLRWPFIARALREAAKRSGMSQNTIEGVVLEVESVLKSVFAELTEDSLHGSMSSAIAGRICGHFGFEGGSLIVDGACASSLLAIATAAGKLERGELDLAIAGGVDISLDPLEMIGFAGAHALTRGEMSVYDRRASGFIPGEGCGVIVLKRLKDAERDGDSIHAVIRGWGISSDGRGAIAAPNSIGQSKAILRAYERAGYSPRDLDFIEGHGTGTPVGDRAELEAVYSALRADRDAGPSRCGITSLKSLIGHTKAASGIGGLIKATIAVNQRVLPPTANCSSPHVLFEVTAPRLYPLVEGEIKKAGDRVRAGVSGMGFGGINCHITLESHGAPAQRFKPALPIEHLLASSQETEVFLFGADSKAALIDRLTHVALDVVDASLAELTDLAFVLARDVVDRAPRFRAAIVAQSPEALVASIDKLKAALAELPGEEIAHTSVDRRVWARVADAPAKIGMVFPGQGSQQINVGKVLVKRHAWAAELVARADRWMEEVGLPRLSPLLFRSVASAKKEELEKWKSELTETSIAQPAICLSSLLWARFLRGLGVAPVAVAGHSLGELSAFSIAGAFDDEGLIKLAARRGQAMSKSSAPSSSLGTMASLMCSKERAENILSRVPGYVVIANINGPAQTVISGEVEAVNEAIRLAETESISARRLPVSNAFHSRLVEGASKMLREESPVKGALPQLATQIIAGASGAPVPVDTEYSAHFSEQVLDRVDFMAMIETMGRTCELLIEVGPSRVLSGMAAEVLGAGGAPCLPVESSAGSDKDLNAAVAAMFVYGQNLAWTRLFDGRLVRPFVAARERTFFTNPCEYPFSPRSASIDPEEAIKTIVATSWSKTLGLPAAFLEEYLGRRGELILEVIRADLQQAALESKTRLPESFRPLPSPPSIIPREALDEPGDEVETEEDSVARDPRESHPSAMARQDKRIEREIIKTVADRLEIDPATIGVDARLTDDLGLPIEDAIEAIEDIAEISGVEGLLDASSLADVSILRIAGAVRMARQARRPVLEIKSTAGARRALGAAEVKTFGAGFWEPAPIVGSAESEDWGSARVVILADDEHRDPCARALASALESMGAIVFVLPYSAASGLGRGRFSHTFAILPGEREELRKTIERLHATARASLDATPLRRKKDNALVLVQLGAGAATRGAMSFARSLHLERPQLRVRVVEVASALTHEEIATCAIRETQAPGRWSAVSYDEALGRRRRRIDPVSSVAYLPRAFAWSKDQVAVVTGGAEGIAAECAIALAEATGIRVAVLSKPDATEEPDPARRVQIERNLARYRSAGVVVKNYVCELTDFGAVRATSQRIREELGAVALVIHGEGSGEPMLAEKLGAHKAHAMLAARVLGAENLMRALASHPLRLFTALTSSAGVTGMREHAWIALGSELTHGLLADFEATTGVRSLAIAYDVWSPIGMGGRSGAVTDYNRHGLDAIPPREGAQRFVELITHDPRCPEVMVTAKSEELDVRDLRSA